MHMYMSLPAEAACDMICNPAMRVQWDSNIASADYLRGGPGDDDYDISIVIPGPLGMSNRVLHFHITKLRDYPEQGSLLLLLARPVEDYPLGRNEVRVLTYTCGILARATSGESCDYTVIDNIDVVGVGAFMQNQLMARMWPMIMSKVERSYKRLFANR